MSLTLRRTLGLAGTAFALLSTACLDDRPVAPEPNDVAAAVRIGFRATILQAAAGQTVHIRAFYSHTDGTEITPPSSPTVVSVTPGVPQTVGVVVRIATCLADTQRAAPTSNTCQVGITLTLEDENGVPIDEQTSPPPQPLPPGGTTTIGTPITFAPVAQVSIGAIPVMRETETRTLTASATDAQGNVLPSRTFKWTSDKPSVLTVNAVTGATTAVGVGSAIITAVTGVKSTTTTARVIHRVASVVITPPPTSDVRAAATVTLVAMPKAADGTDAGDLADRTIAWTVVNPAGGAPTATVAPTGIVTGVFPGDADVTASIDGVKQTIRLRVVAASVAIETIPTLLLAGTTFPLRATVLDAKNAPLANVPITWSTSDPAIITVGQTGSVTAVRDGVAVITATGGGASGTARIHVTSTSLGVQPSTAQVGVGRTLQITPVAPPALVTWQTSNPAVATVSSTGLVTGRSPGNVLIWATALSPSAAHLGTATIVVTEGSLEIRPASAFMNRGDTLRFTATARDKNGAVVNVPIVWTSSNPQLASIDAGGLVFGAAPTVATIKAAGGGLEATASVTITDASGFVVSSRAGIGRESAPASTTRRTPRN